MKKKIQDFPGSVKALTTCNDHTRTQLCSNEESRNMCKSQRVAGRPQK